MKTTFIIIAVVILIYFIFRKKNSAYSTLKSIEGLNDFTLSKHEGNTATLFKQIIEIVIENPSNKYDPEMNYNAAIDQIALEIFKCGMWRLNDKKLANKYFKNPSYINVNKQKFIKDVDNKLNEKYFNSAHNSTYEKFILNWVLKFRDDTKKIDNFIS
jgi:hypothetical protein